MVGTIVRLLVCAVCLTGCADLRDFDRNHLGGLFSGENVEDDQPPPGNPVSKVGILAADVTALAPVTASSQLEGPNNPERVLDGSAGSAWTTGEGASSPHWLLIRFDRPITVDGFSIMPATGRAGTGPRSLTVEWLVNGLWVPIDSTETACGADTIDVFGATVTASAVLVTIDQACGPTNTVAIGEIQVLR